MNIYFKNWIILLIVGYFTIHDFSPLYAQKNRSITEINEAIQKAKNENFEEALPILEKYSKKKVFDDLKNFEINVFLNLSYYKTDEKILNLNELNLITENYIEKNGISLNDSLRRNEELDLIFISGKLNFELDSLQKMIDYFYEIHQFYIINNIPWDNRYNETLILLTESYYKTSNLDSAYLFGEKSREVNNKLFGEFNENSIRIMDFLFSICQDNINSCEKSLDYIEKYVEIVRVVKSEKHPDFLTGLNNLGMVLLEQGFNEKALEIFINLDDLNKEIYGENNPTYVSSISNLAVVYSYLGDFENALNRLIEASELGKEVYGEKDPNYITILENLGILYSNLNQNEKALSIFLQLLEIKESVYGQNNEEYLSTLKNISIIYNELGMFDNELEIKIKRVEISKNLFGETNKEYLSNLNSLGLSYLGLKQFIKALDVLQNVVSLRKRSLGEKNHDYLTSLANLASVHAGLSDFQKAEELNLKIIDYGKEVWGERHPYYLGTLSNLANLYNDFGYFNKALEIIIPVVDIRKRILDENGEKQNLDENREDYVISLSTLGSIYKSLGEYPKSLEISIKALDLIKVFFGKNHLYFIKQINSLALTYEELGDYKKALNLALINTKLSEEILGQNHPDYLNSLNSLSTIYSYLNEFDKSLEISNFLVNTYLEIYGVRSSEYVTVLNNLANFYSDSNDLELALSTQKKVCELAEIVLGNSHPLFLKSTNNLAKIYFKDHQYSNAFKIFQEYINVRKKIFGEGHPDYNLGLLDLSNSEFQLGNYDSALFHFQLSIQNIKYRVLEYFSLLNEEQRKNFWNLYSDAFLFYPIFLEKFPESHIELSNNVFDNSLFSKGLLLNTSLDFEKLISEKGTLETIAKFQDLKILKLQIQKLYEKPIAERYLNVDSLETVAQKLETDLVKLSKEYGDYTQNLKITWKDVQANLTDRDVAIEFLEYPTLTDTVKYAALVLRKGWENPKFVPLFRKDQIGEFVKRDPNHIYSNGFVGKEIRKLIWNPLEEFISPGDRVYFSAAGILHQIAVENLSFDDSTSLGDQYQMHRLSSTKELAMKKPESKHQSVALYGGIKYDLPMRGIDQDTTTRRGWQFLPGTLAEANEVSRILDESRYQVAEFIGDTANEESFKNLSGKRTGIIHIATHGFFLPTEQSKRNPFIQMRFDDQNDHAGYVDPMLRSGLLFAGGNRAWLGDSIPDTIEDGVLTAKEISHLDLRETDLVVLSACETGLGDVSSEGVFGLQRAFKQAGAQTIIMSLWNVKDEATQHLMTNFYSYLMQGNSKREAFIQARNKCREKYQDPASWAAFIMLD